MLLFPRNSHYFWWWVFFLRRGGTKIDNEEFRSEMIHNREFSLYGYCEWRRWKLPLYKRSSEIPSSPRNFCRFIFQVFELLSVCEVQISSVDIFESIYCHLYAKKTLNESVVLNLSRWMETFPTKPLVYYSY